MITYCVQTFSKAQGLAGVLGMCFGDPQIIHLMNKLKAPITSMF